LKKKNNKGFFLAETIVVVALITIVMAFVYPNVAKLYDNYSKRANYYDQIQDLYTLKAIRSKLIDNQLKLIIESSALKSSSDAIQPMNHSNMGDIKALYLTRYITTAKTENLPIGDLYKDDYDFNKYLTRLRKTTFDNKAYRLIGVFQKDGEKRRYASIKIYVEGDN